jgi:hypothetical protein
MAKVKDYPPYLDYPKPRKIPTNADKMIEMLQRRNARGFLDWIEEVLEDDCPSPGYFEWWLELPAKEGE